METIKGGFRRSTPAGMPKLKSSDGTTIRFQESHTIPTDVANDLGVFGDFNSMRHQGGSSKGQRLYDHRNFQLNGRYLEDSPSSPSESTFGSSTHPNGQHHTDWRAFLKSDDGFGDLNRQWNNVKNMFPAGSTERLAGAKNIAAKISGRQAVLQELNSPGRKADGTIRNAIDINSADPIGGVFGRNADGTAKSLQNVIDSNPKLKSIFDAAKDHGIRISPESEHYRPKQSDVGKSLAEVADGRDAKLTAIQNALKSTTPQQSLKAIGGLFDGSDLGRYTKGRFTQTEMGELARNSDSTLRSLAGNAIGLGLAGAVLFAGGRVYAETRAAIAAQRDIPESQVTAADIAEALGIDISPAALAKLAEAIAVGAGGDALVTLGLGPFAAAQKAWQAFQSGEDVGDVIKLLAGVLKDNTLLQNMAGVVRAVENSDAYKALKAAREAGGEIAQSVLDGAKSLFAANGGTDVDQKLNDPVTRSITDALAGDTRVESETGALGHVFPNGTRGTSKWTRLKNGTSVQELRDKNGLLLQRNYWKGGQKALSETPDPENPGTSRITTFDNGEPAHTGTLGPTGGTSSQPVPRPDSVPVEPSKSLDDFLDALPNRGPDGKLKWDWPTAELIPQVDLPSGDPPPALPAGLPAPYRVKDSSGEVTREVTPLPSRNPGETRYRETIKGPKGEVRIDRTEPAGPQFDPNGPVPPLPQKAPLPRPQIEEFQIKVPGKKPADPLIPVADYKTTRMGLGGPVGILRERDAGEMHPCHIVFIDAPRLVQAFVVISPNAAPAGSEAGRRSVGGRGGGVVRRG